MQNGFCLIDVDKIIEGPLSTIEDALDELTFYRNEYSTPDDLAVYIGYMDNKLLRLPKYAGSIINNFLINKMTSQFGKPATIGLIATYWNVS